MAKTTTAVLGMGIMGSAMARRLLGAGYEVRVWNRSPERAAPLAEAGATAAKSAAEAAAGAQIVISMLSDGAAVEAVMGGPEGALPAMAPGAVWIQMSTVGGPWADRLGALAAKLAPGVAYVDAPVLGTKQPAEKGELTIVASGPESVRAQVQPVLDVVGKRTLWVGEAGRGNRVKIVVNSWLVGLVGALAETLRLAGALDVEPETFLEAIRGGVLDPPFAQIKGKAMLAGAFEPSFPLRHALKDARLALEAAAARDVHVPLAEAAAALYERAEGEGHADEDLAAVYEVAGR